MRRPALLRLALLALAACSSSSTLTPAELPSGTLVRVVLPTELTFTSVIARMPMIDSAGAVGERGQLTVSGVLNQSAPCFDLTSQAARTGARITARLIATERPGTCATFAAGAFDYVARVKGLAPDTYDVETFHRVVLKDGRSSDTKIATARVEVR